MEGWIKLHRCLTEKAAWECTSHETHSVLIVILLMVNHEKKHWLWAGKPIDILPGQCITSLESLSKKAKVTTRQARTALENLEKLGFLTNKSTKHGRLITVENWGLYQGGADESDKQNDKQATNQRQTNDKQSAINKNVKNVKNDNKTPPNPLKGYRVGVESKKKFCVLDMLTDAEFEKLNERLTGEQITRITDEVDAQYTADTIKKPLPLIMGIARKKGMI